MSPARFPPKLAKVSSEQLARFGKETPGISMAVLSTTDGFELASYHTGQSVSDKIAVMGSSLQALSEAITREAGLKTGRKLIIESDDGCVLAIGISETSPALSLVVVADKSASLGHLLWSAEFFCHSIGKAVAGKR